MLHLLLEQGWSHISLNSFQGLFSVSDGTYFFLDWCSSFLLMLVHILGCPLARLALQVCVLFGSRLPHGVEDSSVLHDAEQLVGGGHVVRYRPLAISEKGVGRPDFADHQVVQPQDLNRTLEF